MARVVFFPTWRELRCHCLADVHVPLRGGGNVRDPTPPGTPRGGRCPSSKIMVTLG